MPIPSREGRGVVDTEVSKLELVGRSMAVGESVGRRVERWCGFERSSRCSVNWRGRVVCLAFYHLGLWANVAVPYIPQSGGEEIKGTAVSTRIVDKIKERLEEASCG